eukprot:CAMPEP_0172676544 /NCGR_PEP_ID=MMETSP1074-20121228/14061_1 /TAXON_ID=2916 /ORGANISM="Ceratium fusus, Strain PA161109" /LENGTH=154 /DNA_ID=CAMNT_0013494233 /DNA_START=474 /DNA_END=938 /DNA_ORIENTATION=+
MRVASISVVPEEEHGMFRCAIRVASISVLASSAGGGADEPNERDLLAEGALSWCWPPPLGNAVCAGMRFWLPVLPPSAPTSSNVNTTVVLTQSKKNLASRIWPRKIVASEAGTSNSQDCVPSPLGLIERLSMFTSSIAALSSRASNNSWCLTRS